MSRVIQVLGYPTRKRLYNGIEEDNSPPKTKTQRKKYNNTSQHPSVELKLNTIHRCFELGENVQLVSEEIRYSRTSIYTGRKKYIHKGAYFRCLKKRPRRRHDSPQK